MKPIKTIINEILYGINHAPVASSKENLISFFSADVNRRNNEMSKKTELLINRFNRLQRLRQICIEQNYFDKKLRCDILIRIVTHQLNSLYTLPEWN
jgi:hypothetical protein